MLPLSQAETINEPAFERFSFDGLVVMTSDQGKERFPKNAPGPFFVANGECIACMAPEHEAPDLMGFDQETTHCYFRNQPSTAEELERAARAVWVSCCGALHYSGDDPTVHRRIAEPPRAEPQQNASADKREETLVEVLVKTGTWLVRLASRESRLFRNAA
jgi:hypothetical protein